jgi:thiamine-phosphate diphosphorylase
MLRDGTFLPFLEKAVVSGVRIVQLRGKSLPEDVVVPVGMHVRRLTRAHGAAFIVNDRVDLAVRLEADGVHLGQGDASPEEARSELGPGRLIGLSTHNRRQIAAAQDRPVDYIGVGPVYSTTTKENPDPEVGLALIEWACRNSALPVVAIGGITLENLEPVLRAGARNVAVVSAIGRSADPLATTRAFIRRIAAFQPKNAPEPRETAAPNPASPGGTDLVRECPG